MIRQCGPAKSAPVFFLLAIWLLVLPGGWSGAQDVASAASATPAKSTPEQSFLARLRTFYYQDWAGTAVAGPNPPRRGLPSPLNSPPFPNSDLVLWRLAYDWGGGYECLSGDDGGERGGWSYEGLWLDRAFLQCEHVA